MIDQCIVIKFIDDTAFINVEHKLNTAFIDYLSGDGAHQGGRPPVGAVHLLRPVPPLLLDDEPAEWFALRGGAAQGQEVGAGLQGGGGAQGDDSGRGMLLICIPIICNLNLESCVVGIILHLSAPTMTGGEPQNS